LLALLGAHHFLHISRIRVNSGVKGLIKCNFICALYIARLSLREIFSDEYKASFSAQDEDQPRNTPIISMVRDPLYNVQFLNEGEIPLVPDLEVHHCQHKSVPFSDTLSQLL
jgi:hypothetical protein